MMPRNMIPIGGRITGRICSACALFLASTVFSDSSLQENASDESNQKFFKDVCLRVRFIGKMLQCQRFLVYCMQLCSNCTCMQLGVRQILKNDCSASKNLSSKLRQKF
jgi:hypothetical protein